MRWWIVIYRLLAVVSQVCSSTDTTNTTISTSGSIVLTETQLYSRGIWSSSQWFEEDSSEQLVSVSSPDEYDPPGEWTGPWKIVTGSNRDEFGWEYRTRPAMRQRLWIRTYADVAVAAKKRKRPTKNRLVRLVKDEFNFKGFGWTFYKSLVFPTSFGVAFRLPLTYNFNVFDAHPSLPSIGTSCAIYYPWCAVLFLNLSVRMEWIHWVVHTTFSTIVYCIAWLIWTVLIRGWLVVGSAFLFPFTRKFYQPELPLARPDWKAGPAYKRTVEERIGTSWSWRLSLARGYEYRQAYWHSYTPTLASLVSNLPSWLVRHAPAIGASTSGPIPDDPFVTSNLLLHLNGFYFQRRRLSSQRIETVAEEESEQAELQVQSQKQISAKQAVSVKTKALKS